MTIDVERPTDGSITTFEGLKSDNGRMSWANVWGVLKQRE